MKNDDTSCTLAWVMDGESLLKNFLWQIVSHDIMIAWKILTNHSKEPVILV